MRHDPLTDAYGMIPGKVTQIDTAMADGRPGKAGRPSQDRGRGEQNTREDAYSRGHLATPACGGPRSCPRKMTVRASHVNQEQL